MGSLRYLYKYIEKKGAIEALKEMGLEEGDTIRIDGFDMEYWDESKTYDRLGLAEDFVEILDVQVPRQMIPVKPGRNVAIIIEVAARNLSLKRMGYNAAQEMNNRMNELIKRNS
mgnify:CR=1 FL=1